MRRFTRKQKPLGTKRSVKRTFTSSRRNKAILLKKVVKKRLTTTPETLVENVQLPLKNQQDEKESIHNASILTEEAPIEEIDRLIEEKARKLNESVRESDESFNHYQAGPVEVPISFDGLSSNGERLRLMEEELVQSRRMAASLGHQIKLLKTDFEQEKGELEKTIHDLRLELHRTRPLGDHALFSLSKELKSAISEIDGLVKTTGATTGVKQINADELLTKEEPSTTPLPAEPESQPKPGWVGPHNQQHDLPKQMKSSLEGEVKKPKKNKKKLLLTGAVAISVLLILSAGISVRLFSKPAVNEELVNEYLGESTGEVAGATEQIDEGGKPTQDDRTRSEIEQDKSQADIAFADTVWEQIADPVFGIAIDYPSNVVGITKTDSNITFMRKGGYILKIQRVVTDLSVKDYWEQIKGASMDYDVEEKTLFNNEALHLELKDTTDFPGNRYLVKRGTILFDVWYAIESDVYSQDDILRVKRMIDSLRYTNKVTE